MIGYRGERSREREKKRKRDNAIVREMRKCRSKIQWKEVNWRLNNIFVAFAEKYKKVLCFMHLDKYIKT